MNRKRFSSFIAVCCSIILSPAAPAFGLHPLLTEDTLTQGKGKAQIETSYKYDYNDDYGVKTQTSHPQIQITYGILDSLDALVTVPYLFMQQTSGNNTTNNDGIGDIALALKWRFYGEKEGGLQFAVKPSITLPTGNEQMGLGNGQASSDIPFIMNFDKQSYGITFIAGFDRETWYTSANAGYQHNSYGLQSNRDAYRADIWSASLAGQYRIVEKVWLVGEVGVQTNADAMSDTPPVFINGGIIYELTKNIDLDVGYKYGFNKPAVDYSISGAVTVRFDFP